MNPIVVAIAMSLYAYNVSSYERAKKLHDHFKGDCMELYDLVLVLKERSAYLATELPMPTVEVYVQHALEKYSDEARQRFLANGGNHELERIGIAIFEEGRRMELTQFVRWGHQVARYARWGKL